MSMSTYVKGYIPATDPLYIKHSNVLRACIDAGIKELPQETAEYFGSKYPEEYLFNEKLEIKIPTEKFNDPQTCQAIYEVKIANIPAGVEKIRFINSW